MALRGVFHIEDESEKWKRIFKHFPNGVPRFERTEDCINFMQAVGRDPSNPDFPTLQHSITTLISWEQMETYLLPRIESYRKELGSDSKQANKSGSAKETPLIPETLRQDNLYAALRTPGALSEEERSALSLSQQVQHFERHLIKDALKRHDGNVKAVMEDDTAQANAMASLKTDNLADLTLTYGTIPLHPGAARWFEEQGIELPAALRPAE